MGLYTIEWQSWDSWSDCTVSCGGGSRVRERNCQNVTVATVVPGAQCEAHYTGQSESHNEICGANGCPGNAIVK